MINFSLNTCWRLIPTKTRKLLYFSSFLFVLCNGVACSPPFKGRGGRRPGWGLYLLSALSFLIFEEKNVKSECISFFFRNFVF